MRLKVASAALCVAALLAACTPGTIAPTPSPTPSSTAVPSPPETQIERQMRLDYEAAEKAYRTFNDEVNGLLQRGGAAAATATMKRTAAGSYLNTYTEVVIAFHKKKARQDGAVKIITASPAGYSPNELLLTTCADGTGIKIIQPGRATVGGEIRTGLLTVRKIGSDWKLWSAKGERTDAC